MLNKKMSHLQKKKKNLKQLKNLELETLEL